MGEDRRHLRWGLAFSEDHLGHAGTKGAVMIHLGEAEVFERQVAQAGDGFVGSEFTFANLLEKSADGFGVQRGSAISIQPGEVKINIPGGGQTLS